MLVISIIAEIAFSGSIAFIITLAMSFGIIAWIENHPDGLVNRLWNTGVIGQSIFFITWAIGLIITFK